jgi:hypothetical protein
VFRDAGGTEADVRDWQKKMDAAGSPDALHAGVIEMAGLINSRLNAMGEKYRQGMGPAAEPIQLLTPDANAKFRRMLGPDATPASSSQSGMPGDTQAAPAPQTAAPPAGVGNHHQGYRLGPDGQHSFPVFSPSDYQAARANPANRGKQFYDQNGVLRTIN